MFWASADISSELLPAKADNMWIKIMKIKILIYWPWSHRPTVFVISEILLNDMMDSVEKQTAV